MTVLIAILFLHTLDCRLLHFRAQFLSGVVQLHRVELFTLCFQLGIFGKGGFQFGGVFLFLLVQFFQVGFHQCNLLPDLRNILAVRTVHIVQKNRLFGLQFFQQFRQFCYSGGQLVLPGDIPERQFFLFGKEVCALPFGFLDLVYHLGISVQVDIPGIHGFSNDRFACADVVKLIAENQQLLPQEFHGLSEFR